MCTCVVCVVKCMDMEPLPTNTNINICEYINYMLLKMQECDVIGVVLATQKADETIYYMCQRSRVPKLETRAAGY